VVLDDVTARYAKSEFGISGFNTSLDAASNFCVTLRRQHH